MRTFFKSRYMVIIAKGLTVLLPLFLLYQFLLASQSRLVNDYLRELGYTGQARIEAIEVNSDWFNRRHFKIRGTYKEWIDGKEEEIAISGPVGLEELLVSKKVSDYGNFEGILFRFYPLQKPLLEAAMNRSPRVIAKLQAIQQVLDADSQWKGARIEAKLYNPDAYAFSKISTNSPYALGQNQIEDDAFFYLVSLPQESQLGDQSLRSFLQEHEKDLPDGTYKLDLQGGKFKISQGKVAS